MNEDGDVIERLVLKSYMKLILKESLIPSASNIAREAKLTSEREAYDVIYGDDFVTKIDDSVVHNTLSKYRHIHKYMGDIFYEAQNLLFHNWYDFQALQKE